MFSISVRNQTINTNCKCHVRMNNIWVLERKHILRIILLCTYFYDIFLGDLNNYKQLFFRC